jgi:hypothetical protein
MNKYDLNFTQLSRYAKHLLEFKEWGVKSEEVHSRNQILNVYGDGISGVFYSLAINSAKLNEAWELEDMVAS